VSTLKDELHALYADASKHAVYQSVPDFVASELDYSETIDEGWRGDRPRLEHLHIQREPAAGEHWGDFGANTGYFTLSLAHRYPNTRFTAIEANSNHARFILRIADYFGLRNVKVIERAVGFRELTELPEFDFLLHQNVLHHAGHDFDVDLVPNLAAFPEYAVDYLSTLRRRTRAMLFQLGNNLGGNKTLPIVRTREDALKLQTFSKWLTTAGWSIREIAYPERHLDRVRYRSLERDPSAPSWEISKITTDVLEIRLESLNLNQFPGEFYRRPLFVCESSS